MPWAMVKQVFIFLVWISFYIVGHAQPLPADHDIAKVVARCQGKKVALVVNHTAIINGKHLIDTLKTSGVQIVKVFAPEHGFRGTGDAGEHIAEEIDKATGLPIISLYGTKKAPSADDLADIDLLIFDIEDVGVRFYTYLSTLYYCMQACADYNKTLLVLDRPNPNIAFVAGPVLKPELFSFVGVIPIPILHGMTLAEMAQMINGEGWLKGKKKCNLDYLPCLNYTRNTTYYPPIPPSPNLPNAQSIRLYASICPLEGSIASVGRGTPYPFQIAGIPGKALSEFEFTPVSIPGKAKKPIHEGITCSGFDWRQDTYKGGFTLRYIKAVFDLYGAKPDFFNSFFDKLVGNAQVRQQLVEGVPIATIEQNWQNELLKFIKQRKRYLIYPEK